MLNDLAFMSYCQGRIDSALRLYGWALASTAHACGQRSLLAAGCMNDFSKVLRLSGRWAEAQRMRDDAQAIIRRDLLRGKNRLVPPRG